jgi:proteasome accessory factor B
VVDYSNVTPAKDKATERLINLVMLLQRSTRGFTKEEIANLIPQYDGSRADAFSRMFERDKVELLASGLEIEMYQADHWNQDEFRYRIKREQALLPELNFTSHEILVLTSAILAWQDSPNSADARDVRHKLEAFGVSTNAKVPDIRLSNEADLSVIIAASAARKVLKFDYRKPGDAKPTSRTVQPWGVALKDGAWYLYGHDVDRENVRVFNLARMSGDFAVAGAAGAFDIPTDIDLNQLLNPVVRDELAITVVLHIAEGKGSDWRKRAGLSEDDLAEVKLSIKLSNPATQIPRLAGDAPGVVVLEPQEVRDQVIALIKGSL